MSDQPTPIKEIAETYRADQTIYIVEGKLTKLFPPKPFDNGDLQNGEIEDASGKMRITFKGNNQDEKTARGKLIRLESVKGQRGWSGVKLKEDPNYPSAIWVTQTARISYPGGNGASQTQQTQQRPPATGAAKPPAQTTGGSRPENQWEALDRLTDVFTSVFSLVNEKFAPLIVGGHQLTDHEKLDLVQRAAATVFVEASRAGVVANWNPKQTRGFPPPPTNPEEWAKCIVPSGRNAGKTLAEIPSTDLLGLFEYYDEKKANTPIAECVYAAVYARGILTKGEHQSDPPAGPDDDDIPF